MKLVDFCIRYPVTVIVGVLLALLFGVISLLRLPLQMTPTVERPEISVETVYRGAAPQEVEQEVVDRQEEKLISVQNLRELLSTSSEGRGMITLRFDWGVHKDVARLEVAEKLDLVQDVPLDAERPVIRAVSSDEETPIAWIIVQTTRDINEVRLEAEDVIKPRLERIEGVGSVLMFGGEEREVHVVLDYQAMSARGITIAQVREALLRENRNTKGGNIDEGKKRYLVRTVGQFTDLRQIEEVVVATQNGRPVYVRDIASARFGLKERVSSTLALSPEERESAAGQALVADAVRRVEQIEVSERFGVTFSRWIGTPSFASIAWCNPSDQRRPSMVRPVCSSMINTSPSRTRYSLSRL